MEAPASPISKQRGFEWDLLQRYAPWDEHPLSSARLATGPNGRFHFARSAACRRFARHSSHGRCDRSLLVLSIDQTPPKEQENPAGFRRAKWRRIRSDESDQLWKDGCPSRLLENHSRLTRSRKWTTCSSSNIILYKYALSYKHWSYLEWKRHSFIISFITFSIVANLDIQTDHNSLDMGNENHAV